MDSSSDSSDTCSRTSKHNKIDNTFSVVECLLGLLSDA